MSNAKYMAARVVYVDTERMTFDCISLDGGPPMGNVSYSGLGTSGEGLEVVPDVGSIVVIEMERGEIRLHRAYHSRTVDDTGWFSKITNFVRRGMACTPFARPKLPGEVSLSAHNGAGVLLSRGRTASIFSGDLAQLHLHGIMNVIKAVARNYDIVGSGFRFQSLDENGKSITRLTVTQDPSTVVRGIKADPDHQADAYEFQIDVDGPNLTVFAGTVNEKGKRENRMLVSILNAGELTVRAGRDITRNMLGTEFRIGDGLIRETVFAEPLGGPGGVSQILYSRTVSRSAGDPPDQRVHVEERVVGNVDRTIVGNLSETVSGTVDRHSNVNRTTAMINEGDFNITRTWATVNTDAQRDEKVGGL